MYFILRLCFLELNGAGRLITFSAAFGIVLYRETRIHVRIPVTVALFVVLFSLFVCLHTLRLSKEEQEAQK